MSNYHEGKAVYISEPEMYQLIFGSKLLAAKQFKKWVTPEDEKKETEKLWRKI